jgi:protein-S-isoprenylcysteine O-methyltransferase Ste14
MWIIIIIVGLMLGLFGFSQIIYPLFVAWPRASRLGREGKLKKPIPIATFFVAPIVWSVLVCVSIWITSKYFGEYLKVYYGVLGIMLLVVIVQIPKKNRDLEADFKDTWKEYLKED